MAHFMMMHPQIETDEIVERYLLDQLDPAKRQEFEEHFLACEECFEKLQTTERFKAGIADAVHRGTLEPRAKAAFVGSSQWLVWGLAASSCAAVILAVLTAWMYVREIPRLRGELGNAASQLRAEKQARSELDLKSVANERAEANIPVVMLQTSRADEEPANTPISSDAKHVVLWIEIGPSRYREFRLEIFSSDNRLVTAIDHLVRGRYGALAAGIPTNQLPAGDFRITLMGQDPPPAALAGEYPLKIRRP